MAIKPIPLLEMFKWWKNMHEWNTIDIAVSRNNPLYSLPSMQQIFIGHLLSARRCSQHYTGKGTLSSLQPHHVGGPIMMPVLELSELRPREVVRVTQQEKGRTGFLNPGSLVPDQCSGSGYKTAVTKTDWNACPHGADSSAGSEQDKENTKHSTVDGDFSLSVCIYSFQPLSSVLSPSILHLLPVPTGVWWHCGYCSSSGWSQLSYEAVGPFSSPVTVSICRSQGPERKWTLWESGTGGNQPRSEF